MKLTKGCQRVVDIMNERKYHVAIIFNPYGDRTRFYNENGERYNPTAPPKTMIEKMLISGILELTFEDEYTKRYCLTEKYKK